MNALPARLPQDDADALLMRFEGNRGNRYTEILLIGGDAVADQLVAGVYNTAGLNDPGGTGDSSPQVLVDRVDVDAVKERYGVLAAFKNGPRLSCLDWSEVMVGRERDFMGLKARWVMWLDVPEEMRAHQGAAYKAMTGKRCTRLGVSAGPPVFLLDDPDGNTYCMKVRLSHRRPEPGLRKPR